MTTKEAKKMFEEGTKEFYLAVEKKKLSKELAKEMIEQLRSQLFTNGKFTTN
jgi:hypothetical protein